MKKKTLAILIVLILVVVIALAYNYSRRGMISRILPASNDIGFQFMPTSNFITLEVKDKDIAINDFKKIEVSGKIEINFWNNLSVILIGENKKELSALLLKECEKIGKVLKYSLNEGLDTSKRTGINVNIDLVVSEG